MLQVWQVLRQSNMHFKSNSYAIRADPGHGVTQVLPVLQLTHRDATSNTCPPAPGADFGRQAGGDCDMKAMPC